eukprot:169381_1
MNNTIFRLQLFQWQNTTTKATLKWRHLKNTNVVQTAWWIWEQVYGIKDGSLITLDHVMSLLLYTNFSELCFKFGATYRKLSNDETDHALKRRHREYAVWGRLLRETVEVF